ncbi:MAG: hypothetical protein KDA28_10395, partial [Phycisphaerales bacterium]|nr:hypothetical protein [Phycisphaerales bacterium]
MSKRICRSVTSAGVCVVASLAHATAPDDPVVFPVETGGGHILMQASIAGDGPHWFFLDTGAQ